MEHSKGLTHEQVALRDQHKAAEIDKLKCSIVALKQDVETWSVKASKIKKSYLELKEKAETDLMNLREENSDLKEAIKNNDDTMKELKQDFIKMEKVLQKEKAGSTKFLDKNVALQTKIEEQARMLEILHTDNSKLSKLYHDLAEKNMVFQNNKKEIAYLKRAVRELLDHVRIKTDMIAALRANIKELNECKAANAKVEAKGKVSRREKAAKEGDGEAAQQQMPTTARKARIEDDVKRLKMQKDQERHRQGSHRKTN